MPGQQADSVVMHESANDPADQGDNGRAGQFGMHGIIGTRPRGSDPAESNCPDSPRNESLA